LALVMVLLRQKKLVVAITVIGLAVSLAAAFLLPSWYSATARIMPPQQSQSNAVAILGQLGALAGGGASQALGLKNPSDIYVSMLKSRTIADSLIKRFDLQRIYDEELLEDARKELARNSNIVTGRDGIIVIEVEDRDPSRSASIANAYIDELRKRTLGLAVSEASQRRFFFEGQLRKAKEDLVTAEVALKQFTQDARLVNPQGQVGLTVAAAASLRAQIAAKEIQLAAMRSFATNTNPDLQRTLQELVGLRTELAKMEKDPAASAGDIFVPFGKAPEVGMEYTRRFRNMKYQETLFEVLSKQYEIARIDEAKDATLIQTLDVALPPEKRARPKRAVLITVGTVLAIVLAIIVAMVRDILQRLPNGDAAKLTRALASLFAFRRRA
jgi:tyrosine-protein kinase Etk/Wzc